jgi:3-oxoacyl-[acyl-carrier-protein] synthase-3
MKLGYELGIKSVAVWLPPTSQSADSAIAEGRIDPDDVVSTGMAGVPIAAAGLSAPDMAVWAARRALDRAGWEPTSLDLVAHAWIYHQGHDFWSPAHYVAARLGAHNAVPVGIQQMCNGGSAGLEIAVSRLLADESMGGALVTTADAFRDDGFDRWRGDYGVWYGDGATALLVHRRNAEPDALVLRGLVTSAAADMEAMHRGRDDFSPTPRWFGPRIDVRRTKKAFIEAGGLDSFYAAAHEKVRDVILSALRDADVAQDDPRIRYLALPRVGASVLAGTYHPAVAGLTKAEVVDFGRRTGHLGAGDLAANLTDLTEARMLAPGQLALVVSAGAGFTFSCAVVAAPDDGDEHTPARHHVHENRQGSRPRDGE